MYSRLLGRMDDHDIVSSLRYVHTSNIGSPSVFTADQIRRLGTTIVVCSDETLPRDMEPWRRPGRWMGTAQKRRSITLR